MSSSSVTYLAACRGKTSATNIWHYNGNQWKKSVEASGLDDFNTRIANISDIERRKLIEEHASLVEKREKVFKQQYISENWLKINPSFQDIAKSIDCVYEKTIATASSDLVILLLKLWSLNFRRSSNDQQRSLVVPCHESHQRVIHEVSKLFKDFKLLY